VFIEVNASTNSAPEVPRNLERENPAEFRKRWIHFEIEFFRLKGVGFVPPVLHLFFQIFACPNKYP